MNKTTNMKNKIATVSSLILGLTFGISNQPAQATGSRCDYFNGSSLNLTCIRVVGSSVTVTSVQGQFAIPPGQSCITNWNYRFSYKRTDGTEYASRTGPINSTCDVTGNFTVNYSPGYTARAGRICASLYKNRGTLITTSCAYIIP